MSKKIKLKLYKILRNIGFERIKISLFATFNENLRLDKIDEAIYLNAIEESFNIRIPDKDISKLNTIKSTVNYLNSKTKHSIHSSKKQYHSLK